MVYKIAIASSDGVNINSHFNQADKFFIYEVTDENFRFIEDREIKKLFTHSESEFDKIINLLSDCNAVFVSRLGVAAANYLLSSGLRVFESPYPISSVLSKLVAEKILEKPQSN
jgi:predicted Fe-Mo cluster-binding NifX family protein